MGKALAGDVRPPGPAGGCGDSGGKAAKPAGFFGVTLEEQHPSAPGKGSYRAKLSLLLEQVTQPGAHLLWPTFNPVSHSGDTPTPSLTPAAGGFSIAGASEGPGSNCVLAKENNLNIYIYIFKYRDSKYTQTGQDPDLPSPPAPRGQQDLPDASGAFLQVCATKRDPKREELNGNQATQMAK